MEGAEDIRNIKKKSGIKQWNPRVGDPRSRGRLTARQIMYRLTAIDNRIAALIMHNAMRSCTRPHMISGFRHDPRLESLKHWRAELFQRLMGGAA